MTRFEVLKESETAGVKTYKVLRSGQAIAWGEKTTAVEIGGAFTNQTVYTFTTGFALVDGSMIRIGGKVYRVAFVAARGMAGLKRYDAVEVDA